MVQKLSLDSLLSDEPALGDGWVVGIQGATNTGRSVLAAGAPGPILYINTDLNTAHLKKFHPDQKIKYAHLGLSMDATKAQRLELLAKINYLWNVFLSTDEFKTVVWDTHSALWDFIYPLKVELQIERETDRKGPLNYRDANAWMKGLGDSRAFLRPEANLIFLLAEGPTWEKDDHGQLYANENKPRLTGWNPTMRQCRFYIRLYRKVIGPDRLYVASGGKKGQKDKRNVRYGTILKCTDDETYVQSKQEIAEPVWADLQEIMDEVSDGS